MTQDQKLTLVGRLVFGGIGGNCTGFHVDETYFCDMIVLLINNVSVRRFLTLFFKFALFFFYCSLAVPKVRYVTTRLIVFGYCGQFIRENATLANKVNKGWDGSYASRKPSVQV
jgi:hypothetical protein